MNQLSKHRSRSLIHLLLWTALLAPLAALFIDQPLTSRNEDRLILLLILVLLLLQLFWKTVSRGNGTSWLLVALWLFLILMGQKAFPSNWVVHFAWLSALHAAVVWAITGRMRETANDSAQSSGILPVWALVLGIAFLLISDLVLVMIQPSAIPIYIPQFWAQRLGFLVPVGFGALSSIRLAEERTSRRIILAALFFICTAWLIKEHRWTQNLHRALEGAETAIEDGRNEAALESLAQAARINEQKRIPGIQPGIRHARAGLRLRQDRLLDGVFEIKKGIEESPEDTRRFLEFLSPPVLSRLATMPLTRFTDTDWTVDVEPSPTSGEFFILDRWGRILLSDGNQMRFAFPESSEPTLGDAPADLEIVAQGKGAIVMTKSGRFILHGEVPEETRRLFSTASIPQRVFVDFELTPSGTGAYLLEERGMIYPIGQTEIVIRKEEQIQWPYSIARDLEISPDGKALYLMDGLGKVHTFGDAAIDTSGEGQPYWAGETACDIELLPSGNGLYLLTVFGEVYFVGDPEMRKQYRIPAPLQAVREWHCAVALQISPDENELIILERNGNLRRVQRRPDDIEDRLDAIKVLAAEGNYLDALRAVESWIALFPERAGEALDILDTDFCIAYSRWRLRRKGLEPPLLAVAHAQLPEGHRFIILDRWGRLWLSQDDQLSLYKTASIYSAETGSATDLAWIQDATGALILYENGSLEAWEEVPDNLLTLLADYQPEHQGWIALAVTEDQRGMVLANAYGGFHKLGEVRVDLPDVGGFQWFGMHIGRDIRLNENADGAYFLDGRGVVHTFGATRLFTKGEEAPYWSEDFARSLVLLPDERGAFILDLRGRPHPVGDQTPAFPRLHSEAPSQQVEFVDMQSTPDGSFFSFLHSDFTISTQALDARGAHYHVERIERLLHTPDIEKVFDETHRALSAGADQALQERIVSLLSPEWMLSLAERALTRPAIPPGHLQTESHHSWNIPFTDLEVIPGEQRAYLLDLFGRVYVYHPDHSPLELPVQILDRTTLPDLRSYPAVDLELPSRSIHCLLILDSAGQVHPRGNGCGGILTSLVEEINLSPVKDALDLAVTPGLNGAIVMDRLGKLFTYGKVEIPAHELERMGWDFPIARGIELDPSGKGLYLLDGLGSVHALGKTSIATRPEEDDRIPWFGRDIAVSMSTPSDQGFFLLDEFGTIHSWGKAPFEVSPLSRMPIEKSRGERPVAAQWNQASGLFLLTNWGRVDYDRSGAEGAKYHLAQALNQKEIEPRLRHVQRALTADPSQAVEILQSLNPDDFFNHLEFPIPALESISGASPDAATRRRLLQVLTDVLPGPTREQAYILNRWGQIYLWDCSRQSVIRLMHESPLKNPGETSAVAFVEWKPENASEPSFLILDSIGGLHARGRFPDALEEGLKLFPVSLPQAVDLTLSPDAHAVYLLDAFGTIRVVGRGVIPTDQLPLNLWKEPMAKSLALSPKGGGIYLLDAFGAVHTFGQTEIDTKGADVPWFGRDEARCLRQDSTGAGLLLAHQAGKLFPLGQAEPRLADTPLMTVHVEEGEELIRFALDTRNNQFWALTNTNRVRRMPVGFSAALEYYERALGELAAGRIATAFEAMKQVEILASTRLPEFIDEFSPRLMEQLGTVPEEALSGLDIWRAFFLHPANRTVWLLNRWGEIYEGSADAFHYRRLKGMTRSVQAVDFLDHPDGTGCLILYEDGRVEAWGAPFDKSLTGAIEAYHLSPLPHAVDLEWAPGRKGFYITSSRGQVIAVGEQDFDLSLTRHWRWDTDMAASLKAAPDGKALFLFDRQGGIHLVGESAIQLKERNAPYFPEPGLAADIALSPWGKGFYFLDALGGLHTIGSPGPLPTSGTLPYYSEPLVSGLEVLPDGFFAVLTRSGRVHLSHIEPPSNAQESKD